MLCPNCGNPLQSGATFCAVCGATVEAPQQSQAPAQEESVAKNKKKIIWVAVLALVAVIVVAAICIVLNLMDTPVETAEDYVVAVRTYDFEETLDTMPDFLVKAIAKKQFGMKELDREKLVKTLKMLANVDEDEIEDLNAEIVKSEVDDDTSEKKAKDMVKEVFKALGCEKYVSDLDSAAVVDISYECDGKEGDASVLCAKIDGEWYAIPTAFAF